MTTLNLLHLYPKEMNLYGDRGNILTLKKRCEWRGIVLNVIKHHIGDELPAHVDIIFGGGGQDSGQEKILADLQKNASPIKQLVEDGTPTLVICGLYQLFGDFYQTGSGTRLDGISVLDSYTIADSTRHIGNILIRSSRFGEIVGYENHSGNTFIADKTQAFGETIVGSGNNNQDSTEGIVYKNCIGTYLHGPLLPKNPKVADFLIAAALKNKGISGELQKLDDSIERQAFRSAKTRPR